MKRYAPPRHSQPCKNMREYAGMAELADAYGSGPYESNFMQVQVLLPAPVWVFITDLSYGHLFFYSISSGLYAVNRLLCLLTFFMRILRGYTPPLRLPSCQPYRFLLPLFSEFIRSRQNDNRLLYAGCSSFCRLLFHTRQYGRLALGALVRLRFSSP